MHESFLLFFCKLFDSAMSSMSPNTPSAFSNPYPVPPPQDATVYGIKHRNQTFTVAPAQSVTDSVFLRRLGLFLGQCFHSIPDSKGCLSKDLLSFFFFAKPIYTVVQDKMNNLQQTKNCATFSFGENMVKFSEFRASLNVVFSEIPCYYLPQNIPFFLTYLRSAAFKKYS